MMLALDLVQAVAQGVQKIVVGGDDRAVQAELDDRLDLAEGVRNLFNLDIRGLEMPTHVVERVRELPDLVPALHLDADIVPAGGHRSRRFGDSTENPRGVPSDDEPHHQDAGQARKHTEHYVALDG